MKCIEHGQLADEASVRMMRDEGVWWSLQPFLQDEDSAILFMCKEANGEEIYQVLEIEPVRNENYYMIAFDNG